jgi:predicted nucleic acid-binding protein
VALLVLDSSMVIAWLDAGDALHARALRLLERTRADDRVIPASVYAESLVAPSRRGDEAVRLFDEALGALPARVEPISAAIARRAAALRARYGRLHLADALVLATADDLDGSVLTADRTWVRYGPRVRMI